MINSNPDPTPDFEDTIQRVLEEALQSMRAARDTFQENLAIDRDLFREIFDIRADGTRAFRGIVVPSSSGARFAEEIAEVLGDGVFLSADVR